jgi:hypothetical protein
MSVILVVVMARATDSITIGKFLWIIALCSILPIAFDTGSLQFLSQRSKQNGAQSLEADLWISSFQTNRALMLFAISFAQTCLVFASGFLTLIEAAGLFFSLVAMSIGSLLNNQFAQTQASGYFLRLQIAVSASTALLAIACLLSTNLNLATLFLFFGLSRAPSFFFLIRRGQKLRVDSFWSVVKREFRAFAILIATQFTNATSSFMDSALVASFGFASASAYQIIQRPLLLLSLVNVTIGQEATRSALRGNRIERRKVYKFAWIGALTGGAFGYVSYLLLPTVLGRDLEVSPLIATVLGVAFGLSAATSLSGPHVLLAMKNRTLLISSAGQILLIALTFMILGANLGVLSLALGVLLAKSFALLLQIRAIG